MLKTGIAVLQVLQPLVVKRESLQYLLGEVLQRAKVLQRLPKEGVAGVAEVLQPFLEPFQGSAIPAIPATPCGELLRAS
jgi:hypothetical protein